MSSTIRKKLLNIVEGVEYTTDDVSADKLWGLFQRQARIDASRHLIGTVKYYKTKYPQHMDIWKEIQAAEESHLATWKEIGLDVDGLDTGVLGSDLRLDDPEAKSEA